MINNDDYEEIREKIICEKNLIDNNKEDNMIIDMDHHSIRYMVMIIFLYIKILKNEQEYKINDKKKQLLVLFLRIREEDIKYTDKWSEYNDYIKDNNVALLQYSKNGRDYKRYYEIILKFMNNIQKKIMDVIDPLGNISLCPLETIIFYYMIEIKRNGIYSDITIDGLYNIIDIYANSFTDNQDHKYCECKDSFINGSEIKNCNIDKMKSYLINHYELINKLENTYNKLLEKYPKINWLVDHHIKFNGENNYFNIDKKVKFIGYDKDDVIITYIKPQIKLKCNEIMIESIFDTFLIGNIKKPINSDDKDEKYNKQEEDYKKFSGKRIKIIIISLDSDNFIEIEWNDEINNNRKFMIDKIKEKLLLKYDTEAKYVYYYYKYYKDKYRDLPCDKIIDRIMREISADKNKDKIPEFIRGLFYKMKYEIENCDRSKRKDKIEEYNEDKFICILKDKIEESINSFLGMDIE